MIKFSISGKPIHDNSYYKLYILLAVFRNLEELTAKIDVLRSAVLSTMNSYENTTGEHSVEIQASL
jgi:hypothetical protein